MTTWTAAAGAPTVTNVDANFDRAVWLVPTPSNGRVFGRVEVTRN
jgi:hypothetical protein